MNYLLWKYHLIYHLSLTMYVCIIFIFPCNNNMFPPSPHSPAPRSHNNVHRYVCMYMYIDIQGVQWGFPLPFHHVCTQGRNGFSARMATDSILCSRCTPVSLGPSVCCLCPRTAFNIIYFYISIFLYFYIYISQAWLCTSRTDLRQLSTHPAPTPSH